MRVHRHIMVQASVLLLVSALVPPAQAAQPHMEEFHAEGVIQCGVAGQGLRGDPCTNGQHLRIGNQQPLRDDSADAWMEVPFHAGLTTLAIRFTAEGPLDEGLRYRLWWANPPGNAIPAMVGTSGSEFLISIPVEPWVNEPRDASLVVDLWDDVAQVGLDIELDVYLGLFYNGEPVPDGYVAGANHGH